MAKATKSRKVDKSDPKYEEKRKKNNEAIRRTRAKAKAKQEETQSRIIFLKNENEKLECRVQDMSAQMNMMREILEAHQRQQTSLLVCENIDKNKDVLTKLLGELTELNK